VHACVRERERERETCAALLQQNDDLLSALRMLSLGLGAWQIIDSQVFTEPKLVSVSNVFVLHCLARKSSYTSLLEGRIMV